MFLTCVAALSLAISDPTTQPSFDDTVTPPAHQVVVFYFHRTERCPTCKRVGGMVEEAVAQMFPKELKSRSVEFWMVDFQDKRNAELAKSYHIQGPTLVLANVFDRQVKEWTPMPKIWQFVGKPDEMRSYIEEGVKHYLQRTQKEAENRK